MSALSKTCVCVIVTLKGFLCHFGIPFKTWTMCWTFSIGEVPRKFGGNLVAPLWKHLESMCHHSSDLSESFFWRIWSQWPPNVSTANSFQSQYWHRRSGCIQNPCTLAGWQCRKLHKIHATVKQPAISQPDLTVKPFDLTLKSNGRCIIGLLLGGTGKSCDLRPGWKCESVSETRNVAPPSTR